MGREDRIEMSQAELRRMRVIEAVMEERLKQVEAAESLELSDRQVRRLVKRVEEEGAGGLVHRLRGKASNRGFDKK